jgi:ABC-type lipoprotein release transport system permease subunit
VKSLSLRDLIRRPRRAGLNLLALTVGAVAYMVLIAAADGALAQLDAVASVLGGELVVQRWGATSPWGSQLRPEQVAPLAEIEGVRSATPVALGKTRFQSSRYFLVFGVDAETLPPPGLGQVVGRMLVPGQGEVMVGALASRRFLIDVGETVEVAGEQLRVVGVYRTGRSLLDSGAVTDLAAVQRLFNHRDTVNLVLLDLEPWADVDTVGREVVRRVEGVEAVRAESWVEAYGQLAALEGFVHLVAIIALGIAVLGVSSVMQIDVAERTRELSVLRAIGWSRWRVARLILGEGAWLAATAGLLAIPVSILVLRLIDGLDPKTFHAAGFLPRFVPVSTALEGFAVVVLAGLLGCVPPLVRALRLHPAVTLREWF